MLERAKSTFPLAVVIAVLAFLWVEFALNLSFHWISDGDLGNGLHLPADFHLIVPGAFISWGLFFAAGASMTAFTQNVIAAVIGSLGGLVLMFLAPEFAEIPKFWGISLSVAILAVIIVTASAVGDWFYVPGIFGAFAATVFWWLATGADRWAPGGGGAGGLKGLAKTPGSGAFGGVLSTPAGWVFFDSLVTLLIGCVLGLLSVKIAGVITPKPKVSETSREPAHA